MKCTIRTSQIKTRGELKRHRQHWTQDTYNIGHKTHTALDTRHRQHWTQDTYKIGHRTKANKTKTRHRKLKR